MVRPVSERVLSGPDSGAHPQAMDDGEPIKWPKPATAQGNTQTGPV